MKQIVVTAGLMIDGDRVLLAQRYPDDSEGGKWEFPGGKVEFGEDPRETLTRELNEELGVLVKVGEVLEVTSEMKGDAQLILIYFNCQILKGVPTPIECQQVMWWSRKAVDELIKPPADERFWKEIGKY